MLPIKERTLFLFCIYRRHPQTINQIHHDMSQPLFFFKYITITSVKLLNAILYIFADYTFLLNSTVALALAASLESDD